MNPIGFMLVGRDSSLVVNGDEKELTITVAFGDHRTSINLYRIEVERLRDALSDCLDTDDISNE